MNAGHMHNKKQLNVNNYKYNLFVENKLNHMIFVKSCVSERYLLSGHIQSLNNISYT